MSVDAKETKLHASNSSLQEISVRVILESIIAGDLDPRSLSDLKRTAIKEIVLKHILTNRDLLAARRKSFCSSSHYSDIYSLWPLLPSGAVLCADDGGDDVTGMYMLHDSEDTTTPQYPVLHFLALKEESENFSIDDFKSMISALLHHSEEIIDLRDTDGNTALHVAIKHGLLEKAQILIDAGADSELINAAGHTPLDMSSSPEQSGEITRVLKKRAEEDIQKVFEDSIEQRSLFKAVAAILSGLDPDYEFLYDYRHGPVLTHASRKLTSDDANFFNSLLNILQKFGAKKSSKTAYEIASPSEKRALITEALTCRSRESKESIRTYKDEEHYSENERMFVNAIKNRNIQQVINALMTGVNPDTCYFKVNFWFSATKYKFLPALAWAGCYCKNFVGDGESALDFFKQLLEILLAFGADINAYDNRGSSILSNVIQSKNAAVACLLFMRGADPTILDKNGLSAMHHLNRDYNDTGNKRLHQLFSQRLKNLSCEPVQSATSFTSQNSSSIQTTSPPPNDAKSSDLPYVQSLPETSRSLSPPPRSSAFSSNYSLASQPTVWEETRPRTAHSQTAFTSTPEPQDLSAPSSWLCTIL